MKTKYDVMKELNISLATVNRMISSGRLKIVKIGRSVRIEESEIERIKRGE